MYFVGKLNKEIYSCISKEIQTEDVIITEERIQHIKERHPSDYERYCKYIAEIVTRPDYIVESNKPNTALILKEFIREEGETFKTVLCLVVPADNQEIKNSIITFMRINRKEWNRFLKIKELFTRKSKNDIMNIP